MQTLNLESLGDAAGAFREPGRFGLYDCRYDGPHYQPYGNPYGGWQPYRVAHVSGSSFGSDMSSVASVVSTALPLVLALL